MTWTPASRAAAFWGICIPVRTLLALLSIRNAPSYMYAGAQAAVGLSQITLYLQDGRMDAPEGGNVTWWAPYRAAVGLVFIAAAIVTAKGVDPPYNLVPLLDPLLGVVVWFIARPD